MRRWGKALLLMGALGAVGAAALYAFYASPLGELCASTVVQTFPSPDQQHDAVLYELNCGATTSFSTQVTLVPHGEVIKDEPGNMFTADDNDHQAPLGPGNVVRVDLRWLAPDSLELAYDPRARIFQRADRIGRVRVLYRRFAQGGA
jgi:hypothetical protein